MVIKRVFLRNVKPLIKRVLLGCISFPAALWDATGLLLKIDGEIRLEQISGVNSVFKIVL